MAASPQKDDSDEITAQVTAQITNPDEEASPAQQRHPGAGNGNFIYKELAFQTNLPYYVTSPQPSLPPPPDLTGYESPFGWSAKRKALTVAFCCASTFQAAYSMGAYSVTSHELRAKWHISSVVFNIGISVYAAGFACSPMILAPFSEVNGRRPVFLASGTVIIASILGSALTKSFAGMVVARLCNGLAASTFATVCGGIVSDIFQTEHRNMPMALYTGFALLENASGPLVCGFIVSRVSWQWIFYHQVIAFGVIMILMCFLFNETRGSVLLAQRCAAINKYLSVLDSLPEKPSIPGYNQRVRYLLPAATTAASSLTHRLYLSLTIPIRLLLTEPVVFSFSLWISFACSLQYMAFSIIPLVFTTTYHFDTQSNGAVFSAICIGSILGTALSICQEYLARKHWPKFNDTPEGRLRFACVESALLPITLFWFGWTVAPGSHVHWISPVISVGVMQIGIFSIYLAVFNYFADVYHRFTSSALAGQHFCRNLLAAMFPLFTSQMFENMGFGAAGSMLGGIAVVLTAVPWVLAFYGETIRRRSKIASEILKDEM